MNAGSSQNILTKEAIEAYKAAYRDHCDKAMLGFIPAQADEITVGATRAGLEAALPFLSTLPIAVEGKVKAVELIGIAKELAEESGFWRSCSGCHNLNEGVPTGPYSSIMKCHLGFGCRECGGVGAIWDNVDYSDFGRHEIDTQPASTALVEMMAERFDRIATIIDRNLYHQHEKIEDAKSIAVQMREELRALPAAQPVETMTRALEKCQKALAAMIDPSCIAQTTVVNAFAMATEAEASARSALSSSTSREGER